jgi:hypothetical protein
LGLSFGCCFTDLKPMKLSSPSSKHTYIHTYSLRNRVSSFTLFVRGTKLFSTSLFIWIVHFSFPLLVRGMKYEACAKLGVATWLFCGYSYILVVILQPFSFVQHGPTRRPFVMLDVKFLLWVFAMVVLNVPCFVPTQSSHLRLWVGPRELDKVSQLTWFRFLLLEYPQNQMFTNVEYWD